MTEVTIIIPNYNGKKLLENCIKTLERQTCQEFKRNRIIILMPENISVYSKNKSESENLLLY